MSEITSTTTRKPYFRMVVRDLVVKGVTEFVESDNLVELVGLAMDKIRDCKDSTVKSVGIFKTDGRVVQYIKRNAEGRLYIAEGLWAD